MLMMKIAKMIFLMMLTGVSVLMIKADASAYPLDKEYVRAYDMIGHEVVFDDEGHTRNAGPIRFVFDPDMLSEGEMYLSLNGSTYDPIEGNEYTIYPEDEDHKVQFFIKNNNGELIKLNEDDLMIDFIEEDRTKPEVSKEKTEKGYIIRVEPSDFSHVFIKVKGEKNGYEEAIDGKTEITIDEDGIYYIEIYNEDGLGHRTYADMESMIVLDRIPPMVYALKPALSVSSAISEYSFKAVDEVTGVEGIYIKAGESDPVRADTIELRPPFKGRVEYWAIDNAGNISDKVCLGEDMIVDDEPPVIKMSAGKVENEKLTIYAEAEDELSGVESLDICEGDKKLYSKKKDKAGTENSGEGNISMDLSKLSYGEHTYKAVAKDRAGNISEGSFRLTKNDSVPPEIEIKGATDRTVYGESISLNIKAFDDKDEVCKVTGDINEYSISGEYRGKNPIGEGIHTFDKSGIYILLINATDNAGNTSQKSIGFAIDKEAPSINGLEGLEGSSLKSFILEKTKGIVTDDSPVRYDILLNGEKYDGSRINSTGKYKLQIYAVDDLGNETVKNIGFNINN